LAPRTSSSPSCRHSLHAPTLIWTLDKRGAARHRVEGSYRASKLSWNADYVYTVARADKAADYRRWVTLDERQRT